MMRSLPVLLIFSACQAAPEGAPPSATAASLFASDSSDGEVLARIGEQKFTVAAMEKKIGAMTPFVRARYQSVERRKEFVEHLMDKALLAQEAIRIGLHQDPKVADTLQTALAQELSRRTLEKRLDFDAITTADAKTYYDAHYDDYHKPGAVRLSHIYKGFAGAKSKVKTEIEGVLAEIKAGHKKDRGLFRKKAAEYSDDDTTKAIGGDLRYLTEPQLQERFGDAIAKAIWNLPKINTMTNVVSGQDGFHIFRMTGRRHAHSQDFKDVKEQIRHRIFRQKRRDVMKSYLEELRGKTTFELDEKALAAIKVPTPSANAKKPPVGVRAPVHGGKSVTITPGKGLIHNHGKAPRHP